MHVVNGYVVFVRGTKCLNASAHEPRIRNERVSASLLEGALATRHQHHRHGREQVPDTVCEEEVRVPVRGRQGAWVGRLQKIAERPDVGTDDSGNDGDPNEAVAEVVEVHGEGNAHEQASDYREQPVEPAT